jgi:two-component system phosphate regulon sensor histidine kinase PhoR
MSVPDTTDALMNDVAYEALFVIDSNLHILSMNANARALVGVTSNDTLLTDVITSTDLASALEYLIENREREFELQTTIDERHYRVRMRQKPTEIEGGRIAIAVQDVTDLVRLNRARRDMVANISHELRTPIANIRLIIDGLFHEDDKPKRKKSIQSLKDIARETDSLQWIVHELMDLSMIESGQAIVRMVDVPLKDMVDEVLDRMADQADNRDMSLVAKIKKDIRVLCDPDLAKRVLINLFHNALKYAPDGSQVTVSGEPMEEFIAITVSDKGPGIPSDQTERIFERFYQMDSSRSRNEGTGLGLAICKHVVEAHGGKIWAEGVESAGGGKLTFTLLSNDFAVTSDSS